MRAFAAPAYRLRTSSLPLRVTLTGFLAFMALGELTGLVIEARHTGFTPSGIADYYLGNEAELQFPKELPVLIENSHFHGFVVPLVLLVLTHVLFMSDLSDRTKVGVTALAYGTALVELASPWLVRYAGADFAWMKLAGSVLFHATFLFLIAFPLWECWFARAVPPDDGVF